MDDNAEKPLDEILETSENKYRENWQESILSADQKPTSSISESESEFTRYSALKSIATIMMFVGWLAIIIGVIGGFMLMKEGSNGMLFGIMAIVASVIFSLPIIAIGNLIYLFIDTEKNTRMTHKATADLFQFMLDQRMHDGKSGDAK